MATQEATSTGAARAKPAKGRSSAKSRKNGLSIKPFVAGLSYASRRTKWLVGTDSPKSVDELPFTSRAVSGAIVWWDVQPPKTDYWHVHEMLGRAYAFEVLDLLNNPAAETDNEHTLGFILGAIARWLPTTVDSAASGMADGFFRVVSEYVATGTANR